MLRRKFRLRTLLIVLSGGGIILASVLMLIALTLLQKENVEDSLLDGNIAYARKLADTTDGYLKIAQRELAWSASVIKTLNNPALLRQETDRLRLQSGFFNSVVTVNADSIVTHTSPVVRNVVGKKLDSDVSRQATHERKPFISHPYTSVANNYVVFISQPLYGDDGQYLGYIGGTIHLKKQNMLGAILSQHFYASGTTVTIVSNEGKIIFSHDPTLVGTSMMLSQEIKSQLSTTVSGRFVTSDSGRDFLTGYASLQRTDWNILISGTSDIISRILFRTMNSVIWIIVIIIALTTAIVAFIATRISSPLEKLATFTHTDDSAATLKELPGINAWYQEAEKLRVAVYHHVQTVSRRLSSLSDEAMTDPLTGLYNRRGFNAMVRKLRNEATLAVIAIDIDHFKKINDHYGHVEGDNVLIALSGLLASSSPEDGVICRAGGEEFVILLPSTSLADAAAAGEILRAVIAGYEFSEVGQVTVSVGIAEINNKEASIETLLKQADVALYEAKNRGRNTVIVNNNGVLNAVSPTGQNG